MNKYFSRENVERRERYRQFKDICLPHLDPLFIIESCPQRSMYKIKLLGDIYVLYYPKGEKAIYINLKTNQRKYRDVPVKKVVRILKEDLNILKKKIYN